MVGRKPIPTKLRMIKGNRTHRPLPKNEPKVEPLKTILPPEEYLGKHADMLTPNAKDAWELISKDLHGAGILTRLDYMSVISLCLYLGDWIEARKLIIKHGRYVKTDDNHLQTSVFVRQASQSWEQAKSIMSSFGMTPSDRTRIQVKLETGEEEDSPFHKKAR